MTYDLAKELKDAGFPQTGGGTLHGETEQMGKETYIGGITYRPTLSELIEACGDDFSELALCHFRDGTSWIARDREGHEDDGSSAEEAVAKLWLALNK